MLDELVINSGLLFW